MKQLLLSEEIVERLEKKNIQFNKGYDKDRAVDFLKNNNYYMKLASYRQNYSKDENGKYSNLDFAHLVDLSTIDMYLRHLIIKMCLDIEHSLKVQLLKSIEEEEGEDGYQIVKDFLNSNSGSKGIVGKLGLFVVR